MANITPWLAASTRTMLRAISVHCSGVLDKTRRFAEKPT
jgi:hypothetical protein